MAKNEFFTTKTVSDTLQLVYEAIRPIERVNHCSTYEALGEVIATPPIAPIALPEFERSTMDGYAVRSADTFGASASLPAYLNVIEGVKMGYAPTQPVEPAQAAPIHTGGMIPIGADAVVMMEKTQVVDATQIEVLSPVAHGENVIHVGEDIAQGEAVLLRGHRIRPQDIGGLLSLGIEWVDVMDRPKLALMGSGDEIVHPSQTPNEGQVRDINTYSLSALFEQAGAKTTPLGIAKDDADALFEMAQAGIAQADMLVITAGSSISTRDHTYTTIQRLGMPGVLQHGLAVKPGKPTLIGVCQGKPVIGLPGNPVSAMLVARQLILPLIRFLQGEPPRLPISIHAELTQNVASSTGREDTVPVFVTATPSGYRAEPVFGKSNLIFSLIRANGVIHVPLDSNGIKAGTLVEVHPF